MTDAREQLVEAAAAVVREQGASGASARGIAQRAGVSQALVFYHFGSVSVLVETACRQAVDAAADHYREQFARVVSLPELLQLGRELHTRERAVGNVAMMAQLMAGAANDPVLAGAARYAMSVWTVEIESVVTRLLRGSPLAEIADTGGLARAISASFIGLEFYDGVDPAGATAALDAIERLGLLVEVVNDLGPVARRALKSKLKGTRTAARTTK